VSSQPISPGPVPKLPERRRRRLDVPRCQSCGSSKTAVATRTDYVIYVRCAECWFVWSLPKPGLERTGS
jgi:hypothetical protein